MKLTRLAHAIILSSSLLTSIHSTPVHAASAIATGGAAAPIVGCILSVVPGTALGGLLGSGAGALLGVACGGVSSGGNTECMGACGVGFGTLGTFAGIAGMLALAGVFLEESNQTISQLEPATAEDFDKWGLAEEDIDAYNNLVDPYNNAQAKLVKAVVAAKKSGKTGIQLKEDTVAAYMFFCDEIDAAADINKGVLKKVVAHQRQQMTKHSQQQSPLRAYLTRIQLCIIWLKIICKSRR